MLKEQESFMVTSPHLGPGSSHQVHVKARSQELHQAS